jgi:Chitobiase/beta-hexosaminidase C-terminal domain
MRASSSSSQLFLWFLLSFCSFSLSAQEGAIGHHVAAQRPVQGSSREFAADRPIEANRSVIPPARLSTSANPWQLKATIPGAVIHDLSFPTPLVGFAAVELGQVWKTIDGGATWTEVMNLGFPYYWYGVHAFNTNDVIISGFHDQNGTGLIRWSHDGGTTWTGDIIISPAHWSIRPRFADATHGLVSDITGPAVHYTTDGGATVADWTQTIPQGGSGWFGDQFSLLPDMQVNASGIDYCTSADGGVNWNCRHSIDNIFDGETFFINDKVGWVASGEIAPNVEGWVHRTTDGGKTWSGRVLDSPWPIRQILFLSPTMGWAAGGNIGTSVGGIYFSADGGQTWSLDVDSLGHEMDACDSQLIGDGYRVWCAGYDNTASGVVYSIDGASTPALAPTPQTYTTDQSVTLSASTPGATIYYTTDGSIPTAASTVYTGPVTVSTTTTIQAIAVAAGLSQSLVAGGTYTITPLLQFSAGSSSLMITAGGSATVPLTIGSSAHAKVTFSCSGLPAGAACSFVPPTANAGPTPTSVTLTINTSPFTSIPRGTRSPWVFAAFLPGLMLLPTALLVRRRRAGLLIGVLALAFWFVGCGSKSTPPPVNHQPVQATVTVTANAPGATPVTTQIQLTINP